MTAQEEERHARARLRAAEKGQRTIQRNAERRRRQENKGRTQFRAWLTAERVAFERHSQEPDNPHLLRAWRKVLTERPALYGRRERSEAA